MNCRKNIHALFLILALLSSGVSHEFCGDAPESVTDALVTFNKTIAMFLLYIEKDWIPLVLANKVMLGKLEVTCFDGRKVDPKSFEEFVADLKTILKTSSPQPIEERVRQQLGQYKRQVEQYQDIIRCLKERTSPDLYQNLHEKYEFALEQFDDKIKVDKLYLLLKFKDNAQGKRASLETIRTRIQNLLVDGIDSKSLRRQLEVIFGTQYCRQLYDAYLSGKGAIHKYRLHTDVEQLLNRLAALLDSLDKAINEIDDIVRSESFGSKEKILILGIKNKGSR